ncbi:multiple monosaccharide ABC transporter substrate-binding protein [Stackebrandtia nassauensis]|uniref:Xylose ABC transporter, substrate-binding protein n=1 Tax=Stackebrandtia nassauensis (strain DSM 44728 / CIP 108903 / NRRL B-16338 / NBRC 102104 / LLR-40K-21) TaxID=446470 RepID=D3Q982_STANL|nr:multiple monosaccharide ABC transporter substrate-binding protein [Stackebrandtia nassauensis]ADD42564.1 xylose ABC transporter, substrate-binding protein [Stackebrandtia nassauensis DSM 44728]
MNLNRRSLLTSAAGLSTLAVLAACGGAGSEKGTVGIAMPTKSSERWIADGDNMVAAFKKAGFDTDLQYAEDVIETQVSQIENMITKGVKALVIAPVDNTSLTGALQQAADAGIKVISYDRLIRETDNVDYYATFDNFKVGELQGGYIEEKLKLADGEGPYNIELFAGSADDNNTAYFFDGAMSKLKPYIKSKKLVVRSGQTDMDDVTTLRWNGETAQSRMENILNANYGDERVDAVLSPYDGISLGIIAALQSDGYGEGDKPLPVVTGQDAEIASVKSILAGEQTQTVYKDTRKLAKLAVEMTSAAIDGKKAKTNDTESYDNGKKVVPAYLLKPVSVDKDNVEEALVETKQYTKKQLGL